MLNEVANENYLPVLNIYYIKMLKKIHYFNYSSVSHFRITLGIVLAT